FTADVYQRLTERQNETHWPAQYVALLAGIAIVALAARAYTRSAAALLAAAWLWLAMTFHFRLFAELTWIAHYTGGAFVVQAMLLLAIAWWGGFHVEVKNRPSRVTLGAGYLLCAA